MKINVLINPRCLKAENAIRTIKANFPDEDIVIYLTESRTRTVPRKQSRRYRPSDILIAVGGDGTVNEAANAIAGSGAVLAIIPCGTANDLASLYNLPRDINSACRVIRQNIRARIDLISINDRLYATSGGLGFASSVVETANLLKKTNWIKILKSRLYQLAVLLALLNKKHRFNRVAICCNGVIKNINILAIFVNNQEFLGKNIKMTPGARNDDKAFDICVIRNPLSRYKVITLLLKTLTASHVNLPYIELSKAASIRITGRSNLKYFGDGEILDEGRDFEIKLIPQALNLIINPLQAGN